jgi:starch-binding outer membrane protein, SusD/RagB family
MLNKLKYRLTAKKYLIALVVIVLTTTISSCKKYLDKTPIDDYRVSALDFLKNESDYRSMQTSVYTPLQWLNQLVPIGDIASDNSVSGGESASDVLDLQQIDDMTHTPVNATLANLWKYAYEGINRANYLTQYKSVNPVGNAVDFAGKEAMYGEIYFLRAYYYFTLTKMYGAVPLFTDKRVDISATGSITRSPQAAVYAAIEKDLSDAIAVLPAVQTQKGRATKYAAQSLLGKVYLYQRKYDAAAVVLESVITSNAFSLVPNFNNIFLKAGENGVESVFEIQYSSDGANSYTNGDYVQGPGNYSVQQCGIRLLNATNAAMPYADGWSTNLPSQNLNNAYAAGDTRKAGTCFDIEAYKTANPSWGITYLVAPYKNTGLYNSKYLPRKGETNTSGGAYQLNYKNNYRTMRYAEVLLMAAEANNKATAANDAKAQTYLNLVRRRAFGNTLSDITSTGTTLYDAILNERRLELAMEGDRFFDLVRTGKAATVLAPRFQVNKHELFPIPSFEVTVSGLTQNPGY